MLTDKGTHDLKTVRRSGVPSMAGHYETIAKTLAREHGLVVIPTEGECCTDLRNFIKIPILSGELPKDAAKTLDGLIDHESAHVRCVKLDEKLGRVPLDKLMRMHKARFTPQVHAAVNAIVDGRDQIRMTRLYPGVAENYDASYAWGSGRHAKIRREFETTGNPALAPRLLPDVLCGLTSILRGYSPKPWGKEANDLLRTLLADEVKDGLRLVEEFAPPIELLKLGERVIEKLKDLVEDEPEGGEGGEEGKEGKEGKGKKKSKRKRKGDDDDDDDDEDGDEDGDEEDGDEDDDEDGDGGAGDGDEDEDEDGEGSGSGDGDDDDGDSDDSDGGGDEEDGDDEEDEEDGEGGAEQSNKDRDGGASADRREDLKQDLAAPDFEVDFEAEMRKFLKNVCKGGRVGVHIPHPGAKAQDKIIDPLSMVSSTRAELRSQYHTQRRAATREIGKLRAKLFRALKAKQAKRLRVEQDDGTSLHEASLYKIIAGNSDKIFRRYLPGEELSTAVEILVDQSGSMSGKKIVTAQRAVIALAETLNALKIPFEILGWDTSACHIPGITGSGLYGCDVRGYNRTWKQRYRLYKTFDSPFNNIAKERIAAMGSGDNNVDSEAVAFAADRLAQRREARRVLIVMSDGHPACGGTDPSIDGNNIKRVVDHCFKQGLEVVSVGILTDAPAHYYPISFPMVGLDDLSKTLVKILDDLLRKGKRAIRKYDRRGAVA